MPQLGYTTAQWKDMFREFAQYFRYYRMIKAFSQRFQLGRIRVLSTYDDGGLTSAWSIVGAQRGINCSEGGQLFVKLTHNNPGGGSGLVQLYSDSARTQLVAQGSGVYATTVTLAAQNNSGLSGSVALGNLSADVNVIVLLLNIDESTKNKRVFNLLTPGDVVASNVLTNRTNQLGAAIQGMLGSITSDLQSGFIANKLREFLTSVESTVVSISETPDANGNTVIAVTGVLGNLINDMNEEGTPQKIKQNGVAIGAISFDSGNTGLGAFSASAARQHLEPGTVQLTCTSGKDITLQEQFSVQTISSIDNSVNKAKLPLQIKTNWESQLLGLALTLGRTITDTGDTFNQLGTYVISGETLQNTDAGVLYTSILAGTFPGGNNRRVRFHSDAAMQNIVAEGFRNGDGVVTMNPVNNSGLSGSVVLAYNSDTIIIVVNLNPFAKNDIITIKVTNDRKGILQTLFVDIWGVSLPSVGGGTETIPDDLIQEADDYISAIS